MAQYRSVPDSKVHGANMGPIWGRQEPGGPHVGLMNLAIWGYIKQTQPYWHHASTNIVLTLDANQAHAEHLTFEHEKSTPRIFNTMMISASVPRTRLHWSHLIQTISPESKVHGANTVPIWGRQDPDGPLVGPMNFAIWVTLDNAEIRWWFMMTHSP